MLAPRWLAETVLVGVTYYAAARLGLLLELPGTNASPVWPPSGIGLAAMMLFGYRVWPGIAIAALLANLLTLPSTAAGLVASIGICVGNTLEQVVGLWLIRRLIGRESPFDHAGKVFGFVLVAVLGCAVASASGATSLWLTGIIPGELYGRVWFTWWLGDTAGMLILTPALFCWWRQPRLGLAMARRLELGALVLSAALVAELVFGGWLVTTAIGFRPYLVIPVLMWAAFRFGVRETSSIAVLMSGIAIGHTWLASRLPAGIAQPGSVAFSPFLTPGGTPNDLLLSLQLFICVLAVMAVALAGAVAERERSHQVSRAQKVKYRDLYDDAPDMYLSVDAASTRIIECNQTLARMLGYTMEAVIGRSVFDLYHPDCMADVHKVFHLFATTGAVSEAELQLKRKDGSKMHVSVNISAVRDGQGRIMHSRSTWRDISRRKRAEQELERLNAELERRVQDRTAELAAANNDLLREIQERQRAEEEVRQLSLTDPLTGLCNRRGFMLLAEQQWKAARRAKLSCGVLFLDLDGLKQVNDTHGHAAGDVLIGDMARLLKHTFREADIVGRLGGDEFTVFLVLGPGEGNPTARFQAALNDFNGDDSRPYKLSASVGFAYSDSEADEALEQLLARADAAMYGHKRQRYPE